MHPSRYLSIVFIASVCLACNDRPAAVHATALCREPKKIPVYKENVYDLSGYGDEGGGDAFGLFDENALVDPGNKPDDAYQPRTSPQPTRQPATYFPSGKGSRIVIDLQTMCQLTDVYLYDRSNSADSIWIYVGDMLHWKLKTAFTTIDWVESSHWRQFTMDDSSRYLMIRFSSYKSAITEMVVYGGSRLPIPPAPARPGKDAPFVKKTMKEFLGVNDFGGGVDPRWLTPFHYSRMYTFAVDFDPDTIHQYPDVRYNMTHFATWDDPIHDYHYTTEDNVRQNHHVLSFTMQGLPLWMAKNERDGKGRPVTQWGMDAEDPLSYARHANMMWNLAAWFGHTKRDPGELSLDPARGVAGRGTMRMYENGNEEDAYWTGDRYCSPMAYFAQSSADFDGAEGVLGPKCGVANADSGSALISSGLIDLDTNRVRIYKFLCSTLRKDTTFLWKGGVQYHHYSTDYKHGITPEEDSLRWKLSRVKAFTDRQQPGVPCILGENGYDKGQHTRQSTPLLPGLSALECQAIFILRSINATAFSGFDAYILYWLKDAAPPDSGSLFLTSGVLRQMPDGSLRPYPSWFYISTFESRLADYQPDAVVSEKEKTWVYRYRNVLSPDSVAYFVYAPTHNGGGDPAFALTVGNTTRGVATELDFSPDSVDGHASDRKVVGGVVTIGVEEKPKLIFVREQRE